MYNKGTGAIMKKALLITALLAVVAQTGCGNKNDPGINLGVAVVPDSAYIVPGKGVSCVAKGTAKSSSAPAQADVEGDRVTFNRFALQWRSGDQLTIAQVRVTFFSRGISGAEGTDGSTVDVEEEEIAALLGLSDLTIPYANPYPGPNGEIRVINIDSTDASRKSSTAYDVCGLQIGGIGSSETIKTYSARIKIEVIGFGQKCEEKDAAGACIGGSQYPVRQSVTVNAQKL